QHSWALPPFFSHTEDPVTDFEEKDFLYPLLTYDRFGHEFRYQLFQLFSFTGGRNQTNANTRRFTLFPFYFQQRSTDPTLNYTAFLPFYGHLINRFFRADVQ